jgi:hypothetical protein
MAVEGHGHRIYISRFAHVARRQTATLVRSALAGIYSSVSEAGAAGWWVTVMSITSRPL